MSRKDRPLSSHGRVLIGVSWYRMPAPPDGTLRVAVRNIRGARVCLTSTAIARTKKALRQTTERDPNGARPPSRRGGIPSQGLDPGGLPGLGVSFSNLLR